MANPFLSAGVDEAGRGPLAGPVIAAAVILDGRIPGLADSKLLSDKKRRVLVTKIENQAVAFAYGRAEVHEIDQLNIHHASLLAMRRAILALKQMPAEVQVDGKFTPDIPYPCNAIINGDKLVAEISAASILAKVKRDDEMIEMARFFPGYGFDSHKGYPTALHLKALNELGPSIHHRRSFRPVADLFS